MIHVPEKSSLIHYLPHILSMLEAVVVVMWRQVIPDIKRDGENYKDYFMNYAVHEPEK